MSPTDIFIADVNLDHMVKSQSPILKPAQIVRKQVGVKNTLVLINNSSVCCQKVLVVQFLPDCITSDTSGTALLEIIIIFFYFFFLLWGRGNVCCWLSQETSNVKGWLIVWKLIDSFHVYHIIYFHFFSFSKKWKVNFRHSLRYIVLGILSL